MTLILTACLMQDVVVLRNGGRIEGRVREIAGMVEVTVGNSTLSFDRDEVERIEYDSAPAPAPAAPAWRRTRVAQVWTDPAHAISLWLPPSWRAGDAAGRAAASFYCRPGPDEWEGRVDLTIVAGNGDAMTRIRDAFTRADPAAQMIADEAFEGGAILEAHYRPNGSAVRALAVVRDLPEERKAILLYQVNGDAYARLRDDVEFIGRTLRAWPGAVGQDRFDEFCAAFRAGDWTHAADLAPDWPPILRARGTVEDLQRYLELVPGDDEALAALGESLLAAGRFHDTIAALPEAADWEPLATARGRALLEAGRLEEATREFERAADLDPDSARAHYWAGVCYERAGRLPHARAAYRRAVERDAEWAEAAEALRRVTE